MHPLCGTASNPTQRLVGHTGRMGYPLPLEMREEIYSWLFCLHTGFRAGSSLEAPRYVKSIQVVEFVSWGAQRTDTAELNTAILAVNETICVEVTACFAKITDFVLLEFDLEHLADAL